MAAQESLPDAAAALARSSSMDARDPLSRSDSRRKSKGNIRSQRSGNDLFVCFAPRTSLNLVPRPVLSPAREKGIESGRRSRKALSSSIFSRAAKKQGNESEEPTSPKITCIGQVRVKQKRGNKLQDTGVPLKGEQRRLKSSNEPGSPGRSRASPGIAVKPGLESRSKKEHTSSACSSFGKDFSCFGLPCDSYGSLPSFRGDKKSCGTVFAKSLVLIQERDAKHDSKEEVGKQIEVQASASACSSSETEGNKSIPCRAEREDRSCEANVEAVEEQAPLDDQPEDTTSTNAAEHQDPTSETHEEEEHDSFEPEPPARAGVLFVRQKGEHQPANMPSPSVTSILTRSTSAPAQCRVRSSSEEDKEYPESDLGTITENRQQLQRDQTELPEDLPKPTAASILQKSFLKRCKSVSLSLTRSNGAQAASSSTSTRHSTVLGERPEKCEATSQEVKPIDHVLRETSVSEAPNTQEELQAVPDFPTAATSSKRSESEALKVSLDMVPETWLWDNLLRQERDRRPERQAKEWLDTELEASLWKSCKVTEPPGEKTEPNAQGAGAPAEWLDAEVEAALWRSCRAAATTQDSAAKTRKVGAEDGRDFDRRDSNSSLATLRSVGSCVAEGNEGDRLSSRSDSNHALNSKFEGKETLEMEKHVLFEKPDEAEKLKQDALLHKADGAEKLKQDDEIKHALLGKPNGAEKLKQDNKANSRIEEAATQKVSAPTSNSLLVLRYNLIALRISIDAPEIRTSTDQEKLISKVPDSDEQQKKAMLKAMSHLHEVGSCARLLKAASGREPGSLVSSAFRLQRCKSEPVKLTSY